MRIQTYALVEYDDENPDKPTLTLNNVSQKFYKRFPQGGRDLDLWSKRTVLVYVNKPISGLKFRMRNMRVEKY